MSGLKKEYSFKINGLAKSITDVTSLDEALKKLDSTVKSNTTTVDVATKTSRQRTASMSEEEKAEKKLEETKKKLNEVNSEANALLVEEKLRLQEAQRELVRKTKATMYEADSIRGLGTRLNEMREAYKLMNAEQRAAADASDRGAEAIRKLDAEYKNAKEGLGQFQDSVGDYKKGHTGLEKLSDGLDNASKSSMGLAQSLLAGNQFMALFGTQTEESAEQAQNLQKILALLAIVQGINSNLLKNGVIQSKAAAVMEGVHALQVRARAMAIANANKQTIAGTVAQKAFNLVAKANPYVLLAAALLSVVGAVAAYKAKTDEATESTKRYTSSIDGVTFSTKEARDAHDELSRKIRDIQVDIDVAVGKLSNYEAAILRVKNAGSDAIDELNKKEIEGLDEVDEKYASFSNKVKTYFANYANSSYGAITPWGLSDDKKYLEDQEKEKNAIRERYAKERNNTEELTAKNQTKIAVETAAEVKKINEDNNNELVAGVKGTLVKINTARERELKDAREKNKIIADENKKRAKNEQLTIVDLDAINKKYDKQRDAAVKDAGKKASDANKASLDKTKAKLEKELQLIRLAENDKTALITDEFDRRREESRYKYERQREDLEKQLKEDKDLTAEGQNAIRAIIANINAHWEVEDKKTYDEEIKARKEKEEKAEAERKELLDKRIADSDRRNNILLTKLDFALEEAQQKIGEVIVRNKGGLELINVDATQANLTATNSALDKYIEGVKKAQKVLKESHEATLKDLKKGTPEYEEELLKYANANLQLNANLANANKEREANAKASNQVLTDFYADMFDKIGKYAQAASTAISSVTDTLTVGLEIQIESLNEQLDEVSERYDEVVKLREQSTSRVEDLEERLQEATGGTAEALKEHLQSEMHARGELEREEARLQKEKEKREAEIKKKEKQAKRLDMVSNIAQSIANTAMGITQALASIPPPFNFALAALVGAMGAAQVGIMSKQLTKMEDGGLIKGASHAEGGARIQGTNIEVEGGEYVINKRSTAANARLVEFINDKRTTVTAADLVGVVPGEVGTPLVVNNINSNEDRIIDAIDSINFSPKVAVTDIIDASDTVTNVRDLAGY